MELSKKSIDNIVDMAKALEANNFKLQLKNEEISLSKEQIEKEQKEKEGIEEENKKILTGHISGIKSDNCKYIVVSGMTEASLRAMKQDGILAASVVETEQDRFQAIVKTAAPRSQEEAQKLAEMRETLCNRYGNGLKENEIAVPGMHYKDEDRVCRTVSINTIAPALGISRLQERIHEKDGVYTREEGQARAFAAEHSPSKTDQLIAQIEEKIQKYGLDKEEKQKVGYGEQKSKPIFDQNEEKKKEEPQQKQQEQEQTGRYEFGLGGGFLATILKLIKDLILMILNGARHAMAKMQEEKQAKEPWGDKRPYPDNELAKGTILERGGFSKEQAQEKGRSVKEIVRQAGNAAREQEAQQQAEAARKKPGMMATPTRDIDEASLSR